MVLTRGFIPLASVLKFSNVFAKLKQNILLNNTETVLIFELNVKNKNSPTSLHLLILTPKKFPTFQRQNRSR
jgi:hypothetical protein